MLLPTMTYKEMYDHLVIDKQKVDIKKEYLLPKAIKALKKAKKFPACEYFDYKIPATNNQYIIFFYAENDKQVEKPEVDSFCIVFANNKRYIIRWIAGGYKHTPESKIILLRQIHAYTSHFFQRYNERFLKKNNLSSNEIICRFFGRNKDIMPIKINEGINRNIEKYGENGMQGFRVRDGFCFTQTAIEGKFDSNGNREKDEVDAMLILYKTYMPESIMELTQQTAIEKVYYNTWDNFFNDLQKESERGSITLTLSK